MKIILIGIFTCTLLFVSCKKKNNTTNNNNNAFDGTFSGKVKSMNGGHWTFLYTEEGLLSKYTYNYSMGYGSATLTWDTNQVECNDGVGYVFYRPRNAAGYALPGSGDQQTGTYWNYDASNHITSMDGMNYYWSIGNIDSMIFGGVTTLYEFSLDIETRDMGADFVPELTHFPVYNLNTKNFVSKTFQLDSVRDTI